jgi:hypothetical protein
MSNFASSKFNVTIPTGAQVHNDQFQVIVENLTIQNGGAMLEPLATVRQNLTNHGSGNFGGTVEGNFINDAIAASGNTANVSGNLVVLGQLQNTGELNVSGLLETDASTGNSGTITVSNQFKAGAAFANHGTMNLSGAAYISGPGTFTNSGSLQWNGGQFESNVVNNANINITGSIQNYTFGAVTNNGTITQSGGSNLNIGEGKMLTNQAGALYDITDDSNVFNGVIGGAISNLGTFRKSGGGGTSTIDVPFTNSGTIAVQAGTLSFTNALSLGSAGKLRFRLSGILAGVTYGKLNTPSSLAIAGALQVTLAGSFMPGVGNSFDLLDWGTGGSGGSLSGTFAQLSLPPLASGLKWDASQLYMTGVISVAAGIPGDYNQNGVVDAADYTVWRDGLGSTYTPADDDVWKQHFGAHAGSSAAAAVPEPTSSILLIVAVVLLASVKCHLRSAL